MTIFQCDICERQITYDNRVIVGKTFGGAEFCQRCAEPILTFLTEHELLDKAGLAKLKAIEEKVS